jgi:hypothetical protein
VSFDRAAAPPPHDQTTVTVAGERGVIIFTDTTGTTRSEGRAIGPSTFRVSLERKY